MLCQCLVIWLQFDPQYENLSNSNTTYCIQYWALNGLLTYSCAYNIPHFHIIYFICASLLPHILLQISHTSKGEDKLKHSQKLVDNDLITFFQSLAFHQNNNIYQRRSRCALLPFYNNNSYDSLSDSDLEKIYHFFLFNKNQMNIIEVIFMKLL